MINNLFSQLKGGLIVSCQAEGMSPFNNVLGVTNFAIASVMGGAVGIRTEGIEKTKRIVDTVNVPVIGLAKSNFSDGTVRITGSFKEFKELQNTGCHIIAVDGTFRLRENLSGPDYIKHLKEVFDCVIMADIATDKEADACVKAGADCISTTLSGYTPETIHLDKQNPNLELLRLLTYRYGKDLPVIAEGRFNTPQQAKQAIQSGAWAVVVGTAITRPQIITTWFSDAIKTV